MANELTEYFDRSIAVQMEYRDYMGKQATALDNVQGSLDKMHSGIQNAMNKQTMAIVASQETLTRTFNEGLGQVNNTLQRGFVGIANQLGSMTASFNMGFARVENALDRMSDIMNNPLYTESRELYRRAAERSRKGQFEEALEDTQAALEKDKTDHTAYFLQGKIYSFGASKYSSVIDLDKSIDAYTKAARYNEPNIADSADGRNRSAEIYFYLGIAQNAKSNDLLRENKKTESSEMLTKARGSFEQSYRYSDNMLESLFNIARCKTIQGDTAGAIRDLETLILRERNYCVKVLADNDFSGITEQITNLINELKHRAFVPAKKDYDTICAKVEEVKSLLAKFRSLGGVIKEDYAWLQWSESTAFPETLPYFSVLDMAEDFKRLIPLVDNSISDARTAIGQVETAQEAQRKAAYDALLAEHLQLNTMYNTAQFKNLSAKYKSLADKFKNMSGYRNTEDLCKQCEEKSLQAAKKYTAKKTLSTIGLVLQLAITGGFPYLVFKEVFNEIFETWPMAIQLLSPVGAPALAIGLISVLFKRKYGNFIGCACVLIVDIALVVFMKTNGQNSGVFLTVLIIIVFSVSAIPGFILATMERDT